MNLGFPCVNFIIGHRQLYNNSHVTGNICVTRYPIPSSTRINSVDTDQLASKKPADQEPHYFISRLTIEYMLIA